MRHYRSGLPHTAVWYWKDCQHIRTNRYTMDVLQFEFRNLCKRLPAPLVVVQMLTFICVEPRALRRFCLQGIFTVFRRLLSCPKPTLWMASIGRNLACFYRSRDVVC